MTPLLEEIVLILGLYVVSILSFAILYKVTPEEYEKIELSHFRPRKRKEIARLLYDSYLTKLEVYHGAFIGCLFGIFIVLTLLTNKDFSQLSRLFVLWTGLMLIALSMLISAIVLIVYHALYIIETSYEVDSKNRQTLFDYMSKVFVNSANVLSKLPIFNSFRKGGNPKYTSLLLGGLWLIFFLPIMCLMLTLYFF